MLINADFKAMEWLTAVYLSQDQTGLYELENQIDQHRDNQEKQGLPSRLIAKKFLFRLIFGGSAYAYAMDPEFNHISSDRKYWQKAIDVFYDKYRGLYVWHTEIVREVMETGKYTLPTGRTFYYHQVLKHGVWEWPRTTILNYPVQGLGADLMMLARVMLYRRMRKLRLKSKIISTVHDSILVDSPDDEVDIVVKLLYEVWAEIPAEFERRFNTELNVTCRVEVQVGPNWKDMEDRPNAY